MNRKVISLTVDCCCVRLNTAKEGECIKLFEGGELLASPAYIPNETIESPSARNKKLGVVTFAAWQGRWLLAVLPHGRASLFEFSRGKLGLNSTFDCPINTSAAMILDDEVDDCALVVFGTDESRSSRIHVARLTFSSESLAVKPLKIWRCPGGVSSLASLNPHTILVSYTSCDGVGSFDPFAFEDASSPSLAGIRSRQIFKTNASPERQAADKEEFVQTAVRTDGLPVWITVKDKKVLTLTSCGFLQCFDEVDLQHPLTTLQLGFDCVGIKTIPTLEAIVIVGWHGEVALVDADSGNVSRFSRHRDAARVDDFAIALSSDSRMLLLLTDPTEGGSLHIADLGRAALMGSSLVIPLGPSTDVQEEDWIEFDGDEGSERAGGDLDAAQMKSLMRDAFGQMLEENDYILQE